MKSLAQTFRYFSNTILLAVFFVGASPSLKAHAAETNAQTLQLRLGNGRVVHFEYQKAGKEGAPTFLLLPGVNRSLLLSEEGPQALVQKGYAVVTMNFSVQPFSVSDLKTAEAPFFMTKSPSLADLAGEVEQLAKYLRTQQQADVIIPVSLSYSGAVSPFLKSFPLIIETVPLTSSAAQNPELEAYRNNLKLGEMWNPVFGPGITRSLLDQAYRSKWADQVDSISKQFTLPADRRDQMIEGYITLSRATEGFSWDASSLSAKTRRVFIFAGNESKGLLESQIALFESLYKQNSQALAFVIKDSGHLIPGDQPAAYGNVLELIATGKADTLSGVIEVDPAARKTRTFSGAQVAPYLRDLLSRAQ